jgi:hypothetical protein
LKQLLRFVVYSSSRPLVACYRVTFTLPCRGISLLPTTYKILSSLLLSRLIPYAEEIIGDHPGGFQCNRSTNDIFCIHQILEKKWEYNEAVHELLETSRKLMIQLGGRPCIIFSLSLVSPRNW